MGRNERFFAVEGLDGVGKTTVIKGLRDTGVEVLSTPPEAFKRYRKLFEDRNVRARFAYYLAGVAYAGRQAHQLQRDNTVVVDRYLLTTLAAHQAMGLPDSWLNLSMPILRTVEKPSNTFLLVCNEEERMKRMMARGAGKVDLRNLEINNEIMEGYFRWADNLGHRLTVVDTTGLTPFQAISAVENLIAS